MSKQHQNPIIARLTAWKFDYLAIFLIMLAYYSYLQWGSFIGDPDGFYHAKMANWLRQGKLLREMPWMQFSTLRDNFTDHHLLYHLLLAPFTLIKSPLIGVKIATAVFSAGMVTSFYWLLKRFKLIWPFAFALAFISLGGLNFRLSLVKANSLSLIMIWFLIYALFAEKLKLSVLLGFIFVWLYGGWPLALFIAIIYLIIDKVHRRLHGSQIKMFWSKTVNVFRHRRERSVALVGALTTGLLLGILINPYFPYNIYFYWQQFFQIGVVNLGSQFPVGVEWYGASVSKIIMTGPHIFVAALIIFLILFLNYQKVSKLSWFSFTLTFIFFILTLKSQRYVEYYMPFALLFVASGLTDLRQIINWQQLANAWHGLRRQLKIFLTATLLVLATLIMPFLYANIFRPVERFSISYDYLSGAAEWLRQNTEEGTVVWHSSWDEWPILFYHNDYNRYIVGLDPTFMHNYDSRLNKLYFDIILDEDTYDSATKIRDAFGVEYALVSKEAWHSTLIDNLDAHILATPVYEDDQAKIYKFLKK